MIATMIATMNRYPSYGTACQRAFWDYLRGSTKLRDRLLFLEYCCNVSVVARRRGTGTL